MHTRIHARTHAHRIRGNCAELAHRVRDAAFRIEISTSRAFTFIISSFLPCSFFFSFFSVTKMRETALPTMMRDPRNACDRTISETRSPRAYTRAKRVSCEREFERCYFPGRVHVRAATIARYFATRAYCGGLYVTRRHLDVYRRYYNDVVRICTRRDVAVASLRTISDRRIPPRV